MLLKMIEVYRNKNDHHINTILNSNQSDKERHIIKRIDKYMGDITFDFLKFAIPCLPQEYKSAIIDKAAACRRNDILTWMNEFYPDIRGTTKAVLYCMNDLVTNHETINVIFYQRRDPVPSTLLLESIRFICEHPMFDNVSPNSNRKAYICTIVYWAEGAILHTVQRLKVVPFDILPQDIDHIPSVLKVYSSVCTSSDTISLTILDVAIMYGNLFVMNTLYDIGYQFIEGPGILSGYCENYIQILDWVWDKNITVPVKVYEPLFYLAAHYLDVGVMTWMIEHDWTHDINYHIAIEAIDAPYFDKPPKTIENIYKTKEVLRSFWK